MAIFDSHTVRYITFYIVLRDADQVAQLQAQFPDGYQFAPYNPGPPAGGAAIAFNGSWSGTDDAPIAPFVNYVWSPEWTAQNAYPQNVATFERHSGGVWGIGGTTVRYYWVGRFVYKPPDTPTQGGVVPPLIANIPKRRWIEGFEFGSGGPWETGLNGGNNNTPSPDASRHVGGLGLAMRGNQLSPATELQCAKFNVGFAPLTSWERYYIRVRQVDTTQDVAFWEVFGTAGGNVGVQARIVSGGAGWQIALYKKQAGFYTFKQTLGSFRVWDGSDLTWDGFYKFDWLIKYSSAGSGGTLRLYVNGLLNGTVSFTVAEGGLGFEPAFHRGSGFGNAQANVNTTYIDIDDWMCADIPNNAGTELLTSRDWLQGTKIGVLKPTTFGSGHDAVAWPGDVRVLLQNLLALGTGSATNVKLSSTTASGVLEVNTDSDLAIGKDGSLGATAIAVTLWSSSAAGTDGALTIPGRTTAPATIDQTIARAPNEVLYTVDGTTNVFPTLVPVKLRFTKAADANAVAIDQIAAQVELTGTWREEDFRASEITGTVTPDFPAWKGQHNRPWPRSVWGKDSLSPPNSPYIVYSGTYVGNNTQQDLPFKAPIHWLFIRPLTGNLGGVRWWSSMLNAHRHTEQNTRTDICDIVQDFTFVPGGSVDFQQWQYLIRLIGTEAQFNANAVTYHYVAVSDPGGRFMLNFDAAWKSTEVSFINRLINGTFTPEIVFDFPESYIGTTAGRPLMKGPSNGADEISSFSPAAKVSTAITIGAGQLTTKANLHALAAQYRHAFSCWRRHDGNNAAGEPGVMAILSWTGDGTASRTITIAPASGKRPIFAIATGDDNLGGYMRDASHTTNTSSRYDGTSVATGITGGGIDSISVGALLNVNLVNYNMLVLFGDTTLGNGGFGPDGIFVPVEADAPADGPWGDVPDPAIFTPVVPVIPLVGEPDLDQATVLSDTATMVNGLLGGSACEVYTRKAVNIALSRIGVSKVINDLALDQTQEAVIARRHVLECVNATLRAFDWPFATAYETLVVVGGTADVPVNTDWQYSYRAPNRMIKARRIVSQNEARRGFDAQPITFKVASDGSGTLIYCNNATTTDVPLVLEFTTRVSCPAFFGDPMFRDALAWRFAAELAPALSRDEKRQQFCLAKFLDVFKQAEVPAAQEQQQEPDGNADWINARDGGPIDVDWWKRQ